MTSKMLNLSKWSRHLIKQQLNLTTYHSFSFSIVHLKSFASDFIHFPRAYWLLPRVARQLGLEFQQKWVTVTVVNNVRVIMVRTTSTLLTNRKPNHYTHIRSTVATYCSLLKQNISSVITRVSWYPYTVMSARWRRLARSMRLNKIVRIHSGNILEKFSIEPTYAYFPMISSIAVYAG